MRRQLTAVNNKIRSDPSIEVSAATPAKRRLSFSFSNESAEDTAMKRRREDSTNAVDQSKSEPEKPLNTLLDHARLEPGLSSANHSRASSPAFSANSDNQLKANFLVVLFAFLRDNPNSPYMRYVRCLLTCRALTVRTAGVVTVHISSFQIRRLYWKQ